MVKTADYYNVSCDYLLGRCAEPMGKADSSSAAENTSSEADTSVTAGQKMLLDSQKLVFAMLDKLEDKSLERNIRGYLSLAVYRIFRVIYSANPRNDRRFFTVDSPAADGFILSAMEIKKSRAETAARNGEMQNISVTTNIISEKYPQYASSLLNCIKQCEEGVAAIADSDNEKNEE